MQFFTPERNINLKKREEEKLEYRGVVYNKQFGKMVREQDRIQAEVNEAQRKRFFKEKYKEFEPRYTKIQKRDQLNCNACSK